MALAAGRLPVPEGVYGSVGRPTPPVTLLFVGDIMLARDVEQRINAGTDPFAGTQSLLARADSAIGNFEASIPRTHTPTPHGGMRFSAASSSMSLLFDAGFDVLSLANNHSGDFGEAGYANTRAVCAYHGMLCVGHYASVERHAAAVHSVEGVRVGILALHTLYETPAKAHLQEQVRALAAASDLQVAYLHWGVEYETTHHPRQRALAHLLIDEGIDAVIGHHPHVVQDIEVYRNRLIAYSLGNFVFDQYFSDAVQQGLMLGMTVFEHELRYDVIPTTGAGSPAQPQLMPYDDARAFAEALFERSGTIDSALYVGPKHLVLPRH